MLVGRQTRTMASLRCHRWAAPRIHRRHLLAPRLDRNETRKEGLRPPFPLWRFAVKRSLLIIGAIVFAVWVGNWLVPDSIFSWRTWLYWEPNHGRAFGGIQHAGDKWACDFRRYPRKTLEGSAAQALSGNHARPCLRFQSLTPYCSNWSSPEHKLHDRHGLRLAVHR